MCEHTTAIRIIAQSYKVTAEHLLCSLKCIMAMSSAEAFKLRVLIKLVRGTDETWMTALGFHSGLMTLFIESIIGWVDCQWAKPHLLPPQEPMGCSESQMGGGSVCLTLVSINSVFNSKWNSNQQASAHMLQEIVAISQETYCDLSLSLSICLLISLHSPPVPSA